MPYYLLVTFWGKTFREKFYETFLASAMSENNIPFLIDFPGSKLVICTTKDDWGWLIKQSLFNQMAAYIEPYFIDIGYPKLGVHTQLHMSRGHIAAINKASADKVYAGFYAPDLYISDGLIKFALEKAKNGFRGVLTPALRYSEESVNSCGGILRTLHQPLKLTALNLSKIAINSLHSELLRYIVDDQYYGDYPIWSIWRDKEHPSLVVHTVSWALILGDFSNAGDSTSMLKSGTIDGFFVFENFYKKFGIDKLYLSQSSLECTFLSTTSEKDLSYLPLKVIEINNSCFSSLYKKYHIHRFLFSKEIDEFRRLAYLIPHHIHYMPLTTKSNAILIESRKFINSAIRLHDQDIVKALKSIEFFNAFNKFFPKDTKLNSLQNFLLLIYILTKKIIEKLKRYARIPLRFIKRFIKLIVMYSIIIAVSIIINGYRKLPFSLRCWMELNTQPFSGKIKNLWVLYNNRRE